MAAPTHIMFTHFIKNKLRSKTTVKVKRNKGLSADHDFNTEPAYLIVKG